MDIDNLIHMANRIGEFHASFPDREEALRDTASHIQKFWAPRMRKALLERLDDGEVSAQLHPLVLQALQRSRQALMPA